MGTSTNYNAPTSPQWRDLKRRVTHVTDHDTPDSGDTDTQDTPDSGDTDTQDIPDSGDTDTQDTPDSGDTDTQDIPDSGDIQQIVTNFVKVNYVSSQDPGSSGSGGSGSGGSGSGRSSNNGGGIVPTGRTRAARNVAHNIRGFFSSVANSGFREAFERAGLGPLEGKSVREIGYSLLNYLGGPSSTLDQVDARRALTDLMREILRDVHSPEDVEEAMEKISQGTSFANMILNFFGHYIYAQFIGSFYERVTARRSETKIFGKIRNFIRAALKFEVRHQDVSKIDWSGDQGRQIVDNIFQKTLGVFIV